MEQRYYSNGKLLITGEYLVLDGAKALALPTKFGQDLVVDTGSGKKISWKSFDADGSTWFETEMYFETIVQNRKTNDAILNTLLEILHTAFKMNPKFLQTGGFAISTHLTFPRNWGLGTSSTLVNNIAQWLSIDAYELLWRSFGGSGYDIACAQHNRPLLYTIADRKPKIETVDFNPVFTGHLYFVYRNRKQNSASAIATYRAKRSQLDATVHRVNALTAEISRTQSLERFTALLDAHEVLLSEILEMQPVKQQLFPDFEGAVKSLGAWGGDFVLAVAKEDPSGYFAAKGYAVVVPYQEMVLANPC